MITNERHYRISKSWLERFTQARAGVEEQRGALHPRALQALRDQYESQMDELRADLADYESLRRGEVTVLELDSLGALPDALIRARTAARLSQADLATRLGLKKQQVQRYEATHYAGVSLARVQAVAEALGLTIREQVRFPALAGEPVPDPEELGSA